MSAPTLPRLALPSDDDPVVAGAVNAIGGPPGRHALLGERRFWTPMRVVVLLTLLTSLLGFWQKSPCRVQEWSDNYQYTRGCYTDVFALYFAERLSEDKTPYLDHPVEYPVVIGALMGTVKEVVDVFPEDQQPRRFYDLTWALMTAFAVVVAVTTVRLAGRRRPWDAAMFAVAPALALHGTTNWDLTATALAGVGMLMWARRRPVAAGVFLGLATATKLYPVLFLLPLLVLCLRSGHVRQWLRTAVALALTAAAVTVPVYLVSPYYVEDQGRQVQVAGSPLSRIGDEGLSALAPEVDSAVRCGDAAQSPKQAVNSVWRFVELNSTRGADWDSLYFAVQDAKAAGGVRGALATPVAAVVLDEGLQDCQTPTALNRAVAVSFLVVLSLVLLLAWRAPRRPRLPQLLFLLLVGFLLTNKVFSPQYVIWLLPLAVLARPRWRPFLVWMAAEAFVLFTRFYFFIGNAGGGGIPSEWFTTAILLRDGVLVWLCVSIVRDVLHPERDVVRADGVDDPSGGVLDGAPDVRGPVVGRAG